MNIDELCEVIRQRRKRTGFEWQAEVLRELDDDHHYHCPLTAACEEVKARSFDCDNYASAADELGVEDPMLVSCAADNDLDFADDAKDVVEDFRAKLEAACLGPLE